MWSRTLAGPKSSSATVSCRRAVLSFRRKHGSGREELIMHTSATASAQLNVLISGGFTGAYQQLLPEFERTSGIKVTTGSGASQGAGPQTIAAQLTRGVPADVVILSREGLSELIAAKRIAPGTDVDLARVPLGVAVRAGTPKPDVRTVAAFKQVLLKAKTTRSLEAPAAS